MRSSAAITSHHRAGTNNSGLAVLVLLLCSKLATAMTRRIQLSIEGATRPARSNWTTRALTARPVPSEGRWLSRGRSSTANSPSEEVLIEPGKEPCGSDPENWEFSAAPRDVGYWFCQWKVGEYKRDNPPLAEKMLVYGRQVRIRNGPDRFPKLNVRTDLRRLRCLRRDRGPRAARGRKGGFPDVSRVTRSLRNTALQTAFSRLSGALRPCPRQR